MPSLRSIAAAAAAAALTVGLGTQAVALPAAAHAAPADVQPAPLYCGYDNRPTPPSVGTGSTGSTVRELQCLLTRCAYYTGPINGIFDAATAVALRAFQYDQGIPYDGIVGPLVWSALRTCAVA